MGKGSEGSSSAHSQLTTGVAEKKQTQKQNGDKTAPDTQPLLAAADAQASPYKRFLFGLLFQRLLGAVCDWTQWFLELFLNDGTENFFLTGNFSPVWEKGVTTGLTIEGNIPEYVRGEFVRNTPNPQFRPTGGYHWFDGDGMLHGVKLSSGRASYVSRFVKTSRLVQEAAAGKPVFLKIGDLKGWVGLFRLLLGQARGSLGLTRTSDGVGTGNTALVYHAGALLALQEADKPYAVRVLEDGDLETVGRTDYGGALDHVFTAHPKVDPTTGELYGFGYNVEKAPFCIYRVVSASGSMGPRVPITLPEPVMMHDFAVTERHAIFMDLPVVFDPKAMIKENTLPFVWKGDRPARFGLLPRNDTTEANIRWFTRPPCFIFHNGNAFEDGDETVLFGCRLNKLDFKIRPDDRQCSYLTEFRFNSKTGESSETKLSDVRCDFPKINDNFACRKQRFVYAAVVDNIIDIVGVVKFDLSRKPKLLDSLLPTSAATAVASCSLGGCVVGFFDHGAGRSGSEPIFVPRNGSSLSASEDDGCLLNMVFDTNKFLSEVVIVDAKTMSPKPLAVVNLNTRVPYGFHGIFVSEDELNSQRNKAGSTP